MVLEKNRQTTSSGGVRGHVDGGEKGRGGMDEGEKVELGSTKTAPTEGMRDKLPAMLSAPLNALFPHVKPSILYPSTEPTPAFLSAAASRTAWKSRKHLFRAMLVLLASLILVLNPKTLTVLGQASFFGMIVSVMLPPTFPAQVFLLVASMLVMGMLIGWAWGCAAMAAGLQARDRILLASSLQRVQGSLAGATNPDSQYRTAIFAGEFLDTRSTIVFAVMMWIGLFFFGYMRAKSPKAILVALFASIVIDVMCSYGPLFPFAQYTLATTFLIPTACFVAMAVVANLIVFPESLNYSYTRDLVDSFLSPILQRSQLHSKLLATPPPSFHDFTEQTRSPDSAPRPSPWAPFTALFIATQASTSAALEGLLGSIPMLELEVSYGTLSSKDLGSLVDSLRELHIRSLGLGVLFNTVQSRYKRFLSLETSASTADSSSSSSTKPTTAANSSAFVETARMQRVRERLGAAECANQHDLGSLLPLFDTASADLRYATDAALEDTMTWLIQQNKSRWSRSKKAVDEIALAASVAQLETAVEEYRSDGRKALTEPFRTFFDPKTGELKAHHPRHVAHGGSVEKDAPVFSPGSLFTLLSASDNLVLYSQAVLGLVKKVEGLQTKRTTNRLWFPTGLRKLGRLLSGGRPDKGLADGENPDKIEVVEEEGDDDDDETLHSQSGQKETPATKAKKGKAAEQSGDGALNPDARPPKNAFQRFTYGIYSFLHFFTTHEAIFALKYATFSIAIWVPQICKSTSLLMYEEKSLWALIMFQTGLAVYAGDQILSSLQKLAGTAVGLVYGMFLWYFGACSTTRSNPYGLGAVVVVFMAPLMAIRIYAPPASSQMAIQAAVTSILIVGYSWQDTYLPSVGNPGVGYTLAWKRALLVVIGTGIAAVAMLIPPVSTRLLVRRTHATCLDELGRLYTSIISAWLREEQQPSSSSSAAKPDADLNSTSTSFSPAAQKAARARMLALRVKLNSTAAAIEQSGYEVSLRGDFPKDQYSALLALQLQMLQALGLLGQALVRMSTEWRRALVHETSFLNGALIADVTSTFALLSLALRQGSPLPQAMPGPLLDRLLLHDNRLRLLSAPSPSLSTAHSSSPPPQAEEGSKSASIEGAHIGSFTLTYDILSDERFAIYASALQALASILLDLDEGERAVKGLVGVVRFEGYEGLQRV